MFENEEAPERIVSTDLYYHYYYYYCTTTDYKAQLASIESQTLDYVQQQIQCQDAVSQSRNWDSATCVFFLACGAMLIGGMEE